MFSLRSNMSDSSPPTREGVFSDEIIKKGFIVIILNIEITLNIT